MNNLIKQPLAVESGCAPGSTWRARCPTAGLQPAPRLAAGTGALARCRLLAGYKALGWHPRHAAAFPSPCLAADTWTGSACASAERRKRLPSACCLLMRQQMQLLPNCCWLLAAVSAMMPSGWRAGPVRAAQAGLLSSTPPEAGLLPAQQPVRGAAEVKGTGAAAAQKRMESIGACCRSPPPSLPALVAMPDHSLIAHPAPCATAHVNGLPPAACLIAGLRDSSVNSARHRKVLTSHT